MDVQLSAQNSGLPHSGVLPDLDLDDDILTTDYISDPDNFESNDFMRGLLSDLTAEELAVIANSFLEDDEPFKDLPVLEDIKCGGQESSFQENLQINSCVSISTQTDEPNSKRRKTGPRQHNTVGKKRGLPRTKQNPRTKSIRPDHVPAVAEGPGMDMAATSTPNVCPAVPNLSHVQVQWPVASIGLQGRTVLSHDTVGPDSRRATLPMTVSHADSLHLSPLQFQFISPLKTVPQHLISLCPASHMQNIILYPVNSAIKSIPTSPERSASSSPFTPTAAEMPNMPQPATVSQCIRAGTEQHCKHPVTPNIAYDQAPKTPEFVDLFQTRLKEHHRQLWKEHGLDRQYTDVRLVQSPKESKSGKNGSKGVKKESLMFDVGGKETAYLERSKLFHEPGGMQRETNGIALLGHAGMGKSVLVKKICHDWSTGAYSEFKFVFCFECRRLNLHGKYYSMKQLLFELSTKPEENCDEVFKYILRNPSQVLLIFDGIDELQEFDGSMLCLVRPSANQARPVRELFAGLFLKKLLRGCSMLITSRPGDTISQCLAKADKVIEIRGFSPHDVDQYIEKHFENLSFGTECIRKMKECQYLLSNCYIPHMCRTICVSCEVLFKAGESKIARTLTHLFLNVIKQGMAAASRYPNNGGTTDQEYFDKLMSFAWIRADTHKNCLMNSQFTSTDVQNFALKGGFMQSFLIIPNSPSNERGSVFSSCALQNFFVALHLMLAPADSARGRNLLKYIAFDFKKKKLEDIVGRFLIGLLFIKGNLGLSFHSNREMSESVHKQQNTVLGYLKTLDTVALSPKKMLELFHCVYESQDRGLLEVTASKLKGDLDFHNVDLTPPDVYVLQHIIGMSTNAFSLDLRNNRIELQDLKELVGLSNVLTFRASLIDTVQLWKHLQQSGEVEVLRQFIDKFTIEETFRVQTMKNIIELSRLVQIQGELITCNIHEVPAIKTLKILEFVLGPDCGLDGFLQFVKILPACSSLQHLDLSNGITDLFVEKLVEVLPSLNCLQKLSLYHNQIGDAGAEKIANVLPLLTCLTTLALQYNQITDIGAQKLAESLKKCPTIKSLTIWNATIPYGVLQRLQQQDSRISTR